MKMSDVAIATKFSNKAKHAKTDKKAFTLGLLDFYRLVHEATTCPYTGAELTQENFSIERINPLIGYTPENTIFTTHEANVGKAGFDAFLHSDALPDTTKAKILRHMADYYDSLNEPTDVSMTHQVREGKTLMIQKIYPDGGKFLLEDHAGKRVKATMRRENFTVEIPHGKGTRKIEIDRHVFVLEDQSIISSEIPSTDYVKVHYMGGFDEV